MPRQIFLSFTQIRMKYEINFSNEHEFMDFHFLREKRRRRKAERIQENIQQKT